MITNWAEENGLRLESVRLDPLHFGPFWLHPRSTLVFAIIARDRYSNRKRGWICCHTYWRDSSGTLQVAWQKRHR
jgi:hypothetical protein